MIASYVGENKDFETQYMSGELEVELTPQVIVETELQLLRCVAGVKSGLGAWLLRVPSRRCGCSSTADILVKLIFVVLNNVSHGAS